MIVHLIHHHALSIHTLLCESVKAFVNGTEPEKKPSRCQLTAVRWATKKKSEDTDLVSFGWLHCAFGRPGGIACTQKYSLRLCISHSTIRLLFRSHLTIYDRFRHFIYVYTSVWYLTQSHHKRIDVRVSDANIMKVDTEKTAIGKKSHSTLNNSTHIAAVVCRRWGRLARQHTKPNKKNDRPCGCYGVSKWMAL